MREKAKVYKNKICFFDRAAVSVVILLTIDSESKFFKNLNVHFASLFLKFLFNSFMLFRILFHSVAPNLHSGDLCSSNLKSIM